KDTPKATFTRCNGLQQVVVFYIVWLVGDVQLEWEYLGGRIFDVASRFVDVSDAIFTERVTEDIPIFIISVEPQICGSEVSLIGEFTLDLEIGEVVICASLLTRL